MLEENATNQLGSPRSNEWVRRKAKVEEEKWLLGTVYALTLRKFGHLMRGRPSIVQTAIEGSIEGKRKRGRQKTTRAKKVSEANGKTTISATKRAAMDREKRREISNRQLWRR